MDCRAKMACLDEAARDCCEIECRFGVIKQPFGNDRRLFSNYAKSMTSQSYALNRHDGDASAPGSPWFVAGVTRSLYSEIVSRGVSDFSTMSSALGVKTKRDDLAKLAGKFTDETVYFGYPEGSRYIVSNTDRDAKPKLEQKQRRLGVDVAVPASNYDARLSLSTESASDDAPDSPPPNPTECRRKKRQSYARLDGRFGWRIDVTVRCLS